MAYSEVVRQANTSEEIIMNAANISLVAFIERHDGCSVLQDNGDTLLVECVAVHCDMHPATSFLLKETIPATRQAVRDWLGY